MTNDELFTKVQETLVEALSVDDDEVKPEATLQGDLGAESIDFLDISFRLEKKFGIKIARGELFPDMPAGDKGFIKDGKLTAEGIAELRARLPHADIDKLAADPRVEKIGDLFTVQMIINYLNKKLAS